MAMRDQDRGQDNGHKPLPFPEPDSGLPTSSYQGESGNTPPENDTLLPINSQRQNEDLSQAIPFKALFLVQMGSQKKEIDELREEFRISIQSLKKDAEKHQSDNLEQIERLMNEVNQLRDVNSDLRRKLEVEKANGESIKEDLQQQIESLQREVNILKKQKDAPDREEQKVAITKLQEELALEKQKNALLVEALEKAETKASQLSEENEKLDTENSCLVEELRDAHYQTLTAEEGERVAVGKFKRFRAECNSNLNQP